MTDRVLVNRFFTDTSSRAVCFRAIQERMVRDGYTDFFDWVWDYAPAPSTKSSSTKARKVRIVRTKRGQVLGPELQAMYDSGFSFREADQPDRCLRFCSPDGQVHDLIEDDLTSRQKRMLGLIRDLYDQWVGK
jgi:hypothetical protein